MNMDELKAIFNRHQQVIIVGLILMLLISVLAYWAGFVFGSNSARVELENEKLTYSEIVNEIETKLDEKEIIEKDIVKIKETLEENEEKYQEYKETEENHETIKDRLSENEEKLTEVTEELEEKQAELNRITGNIYEVKDVAYTLKPGDYKAGIDIELGRYTFSPIDTQVQLVVKNSIGTKKVDEVLGYGINDVPNYTFDLAEGGTVKIDGTVQVQPLEDTE